MLRSVTFALLVALVAAQGPSLFGQSPDPELMSQDEAREMARRVVEGDDECNTGVEVSKWYPPLPCKVENSTFDTLAERQCPEDGQCNVGPVDSFLNTTAVRVFFCSRPGKYMLYQACRVSNVETGEEREASQCASYDGRPVGCTVGPFAVLSNNTDYAVYYCDTTMADSIKEVIARGVVSQACRIENEYGDDLLRRVCPMGFACTKGPQEGMLDNKEVHAYLCEEHEENDGMDNMLKNWNKTLSETVHYLIMEKEVDPFIILMVMRNLTDNGMEVSAKHVLHKVYEVSQEMAKNDASHGHEKEKDMGKEKEDPMEIMHHLHHLSLMSMQAKVHEMVEEKGGDEEHDAVAMMMKALMAAQEEDDEGWGRGDDDMQLADLIQGMMGKKQEAEEDKDMTDLIKMLMGMGQEKEKKMSKEDLVKGVFKKISLVKAVIEKVGEIEEGPGDQAAKLAKLVEAAQALLAKNEDIMEDVSGPEKVMKVVKAVMIVKNKFEGAEEEEDEDVKWMLVIAKKLLQSKKEEAEENAMDLKKLMKFLQGHKEEEMSKSEKTKKFFKKVAFVEKVGEKVMEIEEGSDDEAGKLVRTLHAVHEMVEEHGDAIEGDDNMKKVMKVMKAIKYVKNKFEGAQEEEDEEVKSMVIIARKLMERAEEEDEMEEGQIKMFFKKIAFVKALGEKVMHIKERADSEGAKLAMLLETVHEMVEEHGDLIRGKDALSKVMKVMKAIKYVENNFRGAEEEEDEDIKWMLMIAKKLMENEEEEERENNPLMQLLAHLKEHAEEEREERNPLMALMAMMKEKKDDEEERNPLMALMSMLKERMGGEEEDEDEKGGMLKEILSHLKELSEKNDEADREGMQVLAFVKALMGGEGGENLQDVMHHLHHLHMLKTEQEMREKYAEHSQQRDAESKAQELLRFMHETFQQQRQQQMGGYGFPPMGRW